MEQLFEKYRSKEFYDLIISRVEEYDTFDLFSKISCGSFFLKTSLFYSEDGLDKSFEYDKAILFLTSLYMSKGIKSGKSYIKYNELSKLVKDITDYVMFSKDYTANESIEAIALSQSSKPEVLEKFKGYYLTTLFDRERDVLLDSLNVNADDLVEDVYNYLGSFYDIDESVEGKTFEEYINNFNDYNKCEFEYKGKFISIFKGLTANNGGHVELFNPSCPLFVMDILRRCFIEIDGKICCFISELVTGKMPKYFSNLISKNNQIKWYDNRKEWSEVSTASLFYNYLPSSNISIQNYYFPKTKGKRTENDILVDFKEFLFIVEVKAANVTPDPVYENPEEVIASYNKQIEEGINQCDKFYTLLNTSGYVEFFDEDNTSKGKC